MTYKPKLRYRIKWTVRDATQKIRCKMRKLFAVSKKKTVKLYLTVTWFFTPRWVKARVNFLEVEVERYSKRAGRFQDEAVWARKLAEEYENNPILSSGAYHE